MTDLQGAVLYLHFSPRLKGILIALLQYRFSSLTFSLSFSRSEPNHSYFRLILPTSLINLPSCSFPCSHTFLLNAHLTLREIKWFGKDAEEDSMKPAKHSPAQILCLPEEHSSRPWQPASLFTYPVCRHMIAMTTSQLPCQFSDAIVSSLWQECAPLTCCFFSISSDSRGITLTL